MRLVNKYKNCARIIELPLKPTLVGPLTQIQFCEKQIDTCTLPALNQKYKIPVFTCIKVLNLFELFIKQVKTVPNRK